MGYAEMREAFMNARFRAEEPEGGWPEEFGVVTACNPMGNMISAAENGERTERLELALLEEGRLIFPVTGFDRKSNHEEVGFGVVCGKKEILALGRVWDQLAVFHVKAGRVWLLSCEPGGESIFLMTLGEMLEAPSCLFCGKRMERGTSGLEYTVGGFLLAGWSSLTLFFRRTGTKRVAVLGPERAVDALFCEGCGTIVLQGSRALKRVCQKCGGIVNPGRGNCGGCHSPHVPPDVPDWEK